MIVIAAVSQIKNRAELVSQLPLMELGDVTDETRSRILEELKPVAAFLSGSGTRWMVMDQDTDTGDWLIIPALAQIKLNVSSFGGSLVTSTARESFFLYPSRQSPRS